MKREKATTQAPNISERFQLVAETDIQINDVLCGRGPLSFNHGKYDFELDRIDIMATTLHLNKCALSYLSNQQLEGNVRYRKLIADFYEIHSSATNKYDRASIVHDVTRQILTQGRFLREATIVPKSWIVMTEQECVEKVSQAMRDANKHSKGKFTELTRSRNIREHRRNQKPSDMTHNLQIPGIITTQNNLFDRAGQHNTLFRDDSDNARMLQRGLPRTSSTSSDINRITSSHPRMEESFASMPVHSLHNPRIEDYEPTYNDIDFQVRRMLQDSHGMSLTGLQTGMLSRNLDNTAAHWESPSLYTGRISRPIEQSTTVLDAKKPAIELSNQQRPQLERLKKQYEPITVPPEKSVEVKEHDSFEDAINETLGPLQKDDVEEAFNVD